jgi:UDP-N-acetylmuramoyl-L-alanyl-D-glutamate--2,6-diaminopimelate ligase
MRLDQLLQAADIGYRSEAPPNLDILSICDDSRRVTPGSLFIVRRGSAADGAAYVHDAIARGAVAVVSQESLELTVPRVIVSDVAIAAPKLAHAFYGFPARSLKVVGITGTNGKTTTAYLLRHLLNASGIKCGLIGTVEIDDGNYCVESEMTTPGAIELAGLLARMRDHGCQAVAMESSSHALDQQRDAEIHYAAAGFTNLTGDHLDYHKTMENYADAKARLFTSLDEKAVGVVNGDDMWSPRIVAGCKARVIRYTIEDVSQASALGEYRATDISIDASGTRFAIHSRHESAAVNMRLVGRHNIQNAMTAATIAVEAFGLKLDSVADALATAQGAPGRLQTVNNSHKPKLSILVDYAHTDDALENVLNALRPLTRGKLRVVFGCGGDRDRTKRPRMAAIAKRLGDAVYVTSDNPRSEDPNKIIGDILSGLGADDRETIVVEPDRRKAIFRAIDDADEQDVVLIAGKGHEKYQIVGGKRLHFDDVEEAQQASANATPTETGHSSSN